MNFFFDRSVVTPLSFGYSPQAMVPTLVLSRPLESVYASHPVKTVNPEKDNPLSAACLLYHGVIGWYLLDMKVELRQCTRIDMFETPANRNDSHQTSLHCRS